MRKATLIIFEPYIVRVKNSYMLGKFQKKLLTINPVDLAEKKLKIHQEKGTNTSLSIFEVAHLMDTILFTKNKPNSENQHSFEICFN